MLYGEAHGEYLSTAKQMGYTEEQAFEELAELGTFKDIFFEEYVDALLDYDDTFCEVTGIC